MEIELQEKKEKDDMTEEWKRKNADITQRKKGRMEQSEREKR